MQSDHTRCTGGRARAFVPPRQRHGSLTTRKLTGAARLRAQRSARDIESSYRFLGAWWVICRTVALAVGIVLGAATGVGAATIEVTTTTDELNSDGDCSLREAIRAANLDSAVDGCRAGAGGDTIVLAPATTYTLSLDSVDSPQLDEDNAAEDDLDITSLVTVEGNAAIIERSTEVSCAPCGFFEPCRSGQFRIFEVRLGGNLVLQRVTVRNGCAADSSNGYGGGISNSGALTIVDSSLAGNSAATGGGAISNHETGILGIVNSTLSGNSAALDGGGIFNFERGSVTITDSTLTDNSAQERGGGIFNAGRMTISDSRISRNSASARDGGGIFNFVGGSVTITDSTFTDNSAQEQGGAIFNSGGTLASFGTVNLDHCRLSGNSAGKGGGIFNDVGGRVTIDSSMLSRNFARRGGGAISNGGTTYITDSTLSDNSALTFLEFTAGGAILNEGVIGVWGATLANNSASVGGGIRNVAAGRVALTNCTLSGNLATFGGGGIQNLGEANMTHSTLSGNSAGSGGGIANSGTVNVKNSIVANSPGDGNCSNSGAFTTLGTNLDTGGCPGFTHVTSAQLNLGPLQDNGGPTATHALLAGSAAIDRVTDCTDITTTPVTTDQRSARRPHGSACDVGAFEAGSIPPTHSPTATPTRTRTATATVTPTRTPTRSPTATASPTSSVTATPTFTAPPTPTASFSPTATSAAPATKTPSPTASLTATPPGPTIIRVTTTTDELNSDGDCSLREAIQAANTNMPVDACPAGVGDDVITIPAGTYALSIAGTNEDHNATGDLDVGVPFAPTGEKLTIEGAGAGSTVISGGGLDRVFHLVHPLSELHLRNVTVRDGALTDAAGAGILSWGVLSLDNVTVEHNRVAGTSSDAIGGGLCIGCGPGTGSAALTNVTVRHNTADRGGGLFTNRPMTITASTIVSNAARVGAGVLNYGDLTILNSTFSGNSASNSGGGIWNERTMTITNSTLSGNSAGSGGGVNNRGTMTFKNSIVADSPSGSNCDNFGTFTARGANLATDGTCPGFTQVTSAQLNLGPLANNGGPTQTHALLFGSSAVDAAADCTDVAGIPVATDQRGVSRPQGSACDVGAFEADRFPFTNSPTVTPTSTRTATASASATRTPTRSPTTTASPTSSVTATPTFTAPPTATATASATLTLTIPPSKTPSPTSSFTATRTATRAPTATATASATVTRTLPPTPETPSPTATPAPCPCVGDCDAGGEVTVDEIIIMVNVALGNVSPTACLVGDANQDGEITIDEIVTAVNNALNECPDCPLAGTDTTPTLR